MELVKLIAIALIVFSVFAVFFIIIDQIKLDKQHEENIQICLNQLYSIKPFSVADYYDRIEKANLKILQEKENQDDYKITLCIGLDGIRLNDDGTTEWIKRNENNKISVESTTSPLQNCNSFTYNSQCQNVSQSQNFNSLQNQINSLQTQNSSYYWQQLQYQQCQNMINTIQPSIYPFYIQTYPAYSYFPLFSQSCCTPGPYSVKW